MNDVPLLFDKIKKNPIHHDFQVKQTSVRGCYEQDILCFGTHEGTGLSPKCAIIIVLILIFKNFQNLIQILLSKFPKHFLNVLFYL